MHGTCGPRGSVSLEELRREATVAKALPYGPRRIDRTHSARLDHQRVDLRGLAARENL